MTSEEICNGNALIAHFMGLKRGDDWQVRNGDANWCHPVDLKYNTSWDWLMPVVEKIDLYANVRVSPKICSITMKFIEGKKYAKEHDMFFDFVPPIAECNHKGFMVNTWVAIIEFINWHYEKNNIEKPKPIEFYEG